MGISGAPGSRGLCQGHAQETNYFKLLTPIIDKSVMLEDHTLWLLQPFVDQLVMISNRSHKLNEGGACYEKESLVVKSGHHANFLC